MLTRETHRTAEMFSSLFPMVSILLPRIHFCHLNLRTYRFVLLALIMPFSARSKCPEGVNNFFFVSTLTESSQLPFFPLECKSSELSSLSLTKRHFSPLPLANTFFSDCFLNLPQCFHIPLKIADIRTG